MKSNYKSLFAMVPLYNMGVRDITKIHSFYILFITFSIISIFVSNFQAYAVEEIWTDYGTMKELVKDIRNGNKDDDKVNYDKFKDSSVYKNANEDLRKCIDLADKVGEKLGDYEIVRCFENTNYFKEKYVDDNNQKVDNQSEQQNVTNQNQTSNESKIVTESKVSSNDGCDPSYPDICITTYSEKLSCADIPFRNFKVLSPDSRGFDSDSDGLGCEG